MELPALPLVILDTETTGFVPRMHRVIEFAAVIFENGQKTHEYEQLFSIEEQIPPHIRALTHISDDDLKGKPTFKDTMQEMLAMFPKNAIIVGQNIPFDISMLKGEGMDLSSYPWIDTSMLASLVFPELQSYSLGFVSDVLKLPHEPKHRALGDVNATVALLEKVTERLQELPEDMLTIVKGLAARSPEGYKQYFNALKSKGKKAPSWLEIPSPATFGGHEDLHELPTARTGEVSLVEESLSPTFVEGVLAGLAKRKEKTFVAVKNLEAGIKRLKLPKGTDIHYPPELVVDPHGVETLLEQQSFTADEATLAMKLYLFDPKTRGDMPIHGDEYAVWNAKIACTSESATYRKMLESESKVILLDHQQLLSRAAQGTLDASASVVIDDASMLEESATRAFGWRCSLSTLRAAAEGNADLTRMTDLLELWAEKTRHGVDVRYLVANDVTSREAEGLKDHIAAAKKDASTLIKRALGDLELILNPDNLGGRITWIETRMDGEKAIESVPADTATLLKEILYDRVPTTLLVPPGEEPDFPMILPRGMSAQHHGLDEKARTLLPIYEGKEWNAAAWLDATEGKSIVLVGSRRLLEEIYIAHGARLEKKGIMLFCQGLSGGLSRMQAQFEAHQGPAVMALTPWMYEGADLAPNLVNRLALLTLPFDHPSHAIVGQRSTLFANGFTDYVMHRVEHRLFRMLRMFARHRTENGSVEMYDTRLKTKDYGQEIRKYVSQFIAMKKEAVEEKKEATEVAHVKEEVQKEKKVKESKPKKATPIDPNQQALF